VDAANGDLPGEPLLPDVDLLLRTGGERRLSDFLLWECAYAELAFLDVHFPDLSTADLDAVFADYAKRDRRYGGVQVTDHSTPADTEPALHAARR
jgi:undecaprenyl diphosphate synthase